MEKSIKLVKSLSTDLILLLFFYLFVMLIFQNNLFSNLFPNISNLKIILNMNTIFLGIILEAFPFLLFGSLISAGIQAFINEKVIQRVIPKNPFAAIIPAIALAFLIPVCECAVIPVMRRLTKKGLPQHIGMIFIVTAPILNPITVVSTYFAFRSHISVFYGRIGLACLVAVCVGLIVFLTYRNSPQLKFTTQNENIHFGHDHDHDHKHHLLHSRLRTILYHTVDDFFDSGKYLIAGALLAATFQTFFNQNMISHIASNATSSTLIMMIFSFFISLCSQADAFVAASFMGKFTPGSIVAFLVFGPILDLKTTIMLFAYFRKKFVISFIACITFIVFSSCLIL